MAIPWTMEPGMDALALSDAQAAMWIGAAGALGVAVFAGWRERRRRRRADLDAVGLVAWPTVQLLALLAVAICIGLALQ